MYSIAGDIDYEVIVLDNASFDGCAELLARGYPAVIFMESEQNLGFARGIQFTGGVSLVNYLISRW